MRIQAAAYLIALFAGAASGQTDRVLRFWHTEGKQNVSQIATLIHVVADAETLADPAGTTLKLRGTADQIELGEWLFHELDKAQIPDSGTHEFHLPGGGENTVRLLYIRNTPELKDFHAIATAIRTLGDVKRVGTYGGPNVLAVRGTHDQVLLAAFLVGELDLPIGTRAKSAEYRLPPSADRFDETLVRIFYVTHAPTIQDLQEITTAVRTMANVRRVVTYNPSKAMIVRSSTAAVAFADWLIQQFDKPPVVEAGTLASAIPSYQYDEPAGHDEVRVFYLPQTPSIAEFQQVATRVRATAGLRRVCTYNAPRVMAIRGAANQVAMAEQLMKEFNASRQLQPPR